MTYLVDEAAAKRNREWQSERDKKRLSRKLRNREKFDARLAEAKLNPRSNLRVKQLAPAPNYHKTKKQNRAQELINLRARVIELEQQLASARKARTNSDFYDSPAWHTLRYAALRRSNGCCELCGESKATGAIIQVDHIKPRSKFPQLELDQENLQVLCKPCNMGKSNRDSIDWRKPELKVVRGD